jgi:hypothetical protein
MNVWGGGVCMAGNTQSPGDWVKEGQGGVQLRIETVLSANIRNGKC